MPDQPATESPVIPAFSTLWARFNGMDSWKAVLLVVVLYGGGTSTLNWVRGLWDGAGLNNSVIERIGLAETNIIREVRVEKEKETTP